MEHLKPKILLCENRFGKYLCSMHSSTLKSKKKVQSSMVGMEEKKHIDFICCFEVLAN